MKKTLRVFFAVSFATASIAQDGGHDSSVAASRSAHETVWQRWEWSTNSLGRVAARTNEFVEVATGLNHLSDETPPQWQPSREEWEVYPDAVVARAGQHKVILAYNLNLAGAVDVLTPDGQRLVSSPVSLGFYDPVDGKQVVIAEVRDCAAERGTAANEIVFRNCFDRVRGSIRFLQTKAGVHQHVVLEQKLELPEGFSDRSRLEFYTVFDAATPWPQITTRVLRREQDPVRRAQMVESDFTDAELDFGSMAMRAGTAFCLGDEETTRSIRVGKQFQMIGGQPVLIEGVEFKSLEPLLAGLANVERSGTGGLAINSSRQIKRAKEQARLPREHYRGFQNGKEIQLASRPLREPAVVIDYELVFSNDLPATITPMSVMVPPSSIGVNFTVSTQNGWMSANIPPFVFGEPSIPPFNEKYTHNNGDSGSPNMIPMPDGSLVFIGGTTSSEPSIHPMQADINKLSESRGFTNVYQLTWHNYNP